MADEKMKAALRCAHIRWFRSLHSTGWTLGANRGERQHPLLQPRWDDLEEPQKEADMALARLIHELTHRRQAMESLSEDEAVEQMIKLLTHSLAAIRRV